jgi:dynein heavy chain
MILIKAMIDSNVPKFLKEDIPLFNAIILDLFPNSNLEVEMDNKIIEALNEA